MTVTVYDATNPHPGKFVGIRVCRCVDGRLRQKYFPFRRDGEYISAEEEHAVWIRAQALDATWKAEQAMCRRARERLAMPTARAAWHTTVRGIRFVWLRDFKHGRTYFTPAFEVCAASRSREDSTPITRFRIPRLGYEDAWREAVRTLARLKEIRDYAHLLRRIPAKAETLGEAYPQNNNTPDISA